MRLQVIDIAKGIGIILVVLGHNKFFRENAAAAYFLIYLFHMPLFFCLSGMVINKPVDRQIIWKRFSSLGAPYVMGVLLTLPMQLMKPEHPSNASPVLGFFWGTGNAIYNTPIWFLPSLFSAILVLWAVDRLTTSPRQKMVVAAALFAASVSLLAARIGFDRLPVNALGQTIGAPWSFDLAPLMASFMIAGQMLKPYLTSSKPSALQVAAAMVVCGAVLFGVYDIFLPRLDLNYRELEHGTATAVCMVAGIALVLSVSSWAAHHGPAWMANALSVVGKSSLIILIMHSSMQGVLLRALERVGVLGMVPALAVTVFVVTLLTFVSEKIINRNWVLTRLFYAR